MTTTIYYIQQVKNKTIIGLKYICVLMNMEAL